MPVKRNNSNTANANITTSPPSSQVETAAELRKAAEALGIDVTEMLESEVQALLEEARQRQRPGANQSAAAMDTAFAGTIAQAIVGTLEPAVARAVGAAMSGPLREMADTVREITKSVQQLTAVAARQSRSGGDAVVRVDIPEYARPPEPDPAWVNPHPDIAEMLSARARDGDICSLLVTGPSGVGKTYWAAQYAAHSGRPYVPIEVGAIADSQDFLGRDTLKDGNTAYQDSLLVQAVQLPGAIILFNELNRVYSERDLNTLLRPLDFQRCIETPNGLVKVAPGVTFIATMNQGRAYTGTAVLDQAMRSRFDAEIELDFMTPEEETEVLIANGVLPDNAKIIINVAKIIRAVGSTNISTRTTINAGLMAEHIGIDKAIRLAFKTGASDELIASTLGMV